MLENLSLSLQSIWAHKLRSILTMLGVIIGIAAIISIFSIIEGNTANMKKQIMGGPNNTMNVDFGPASQFSGSMGMGGNQSFTFDPGNQSYTTDPNIYIIANQLIVAARSWYDIMVY